jgi:hypothetical protein
MPGLYGLYNGNMPVICQEQKNAASHLCVQFCLGTAVFQQTGEQ